MIRVLNLLIALLLWLSTPAQSNSLIFGIGAEGVDGNDPTTTVFYLEYKSEPFFERGIFSASFNTTTRIDTDTDFFIGGGAIAELSLFHRVFFEASLLPGFYSEGDDGTDLGGNFQFRSLFGLGFNLNAKSAVSLAIDHLSNAGIESKNPGTEAVTFRYRRRF